MFFAFLTHFQQINVLFSVIFLLRLNSLTSKSVFVIKFACATHALKTLAVKVLSFGAVIYLS